MSGEVRRSRSIRAAGVAILAVLFAAVSYAPAFAQARIAFASSRDGGWAQIYTMNANGKGQTRLTFENSPNLQPNFSPDGSKIAFASNRTGNWEIFVMNADGTEQARITNHGSADFAPVWSPDGMDIAFVSRRSGNNEIWRMKANGSGLVKLTTDPADDTYPIWCWDPNNNAIAFISNRAVPGDTEAPNFEIWTMNADGTGQARFTDQDDVLGRYKHGGPDQAPSWTPDLSTAAGYQGAIVFSSYQGLNSQVFIREFPVPAGPAYFDPLTGPDSPAANSGDSFRPSASRDGNRVAFDSNRDGTPGEIYVMNLDGTNHQRLTSTNASNVSANFSPYRPLAQTRIAFVSQRDLVDGQIYTMNRDGSGQQRLTYSPTAANLQPAWSPDRRKIVFVSNRDGDYEIYVMNWDGTGQTRITNALGIDATPAWSPDGTKITFASKRTGTYQIYSMNANGSSQARLTTGGATDLYPTYSPDGSKILFQSDRTGQKHQVYAMNTNGTGVVMLTVDGANYNPAWSPDGTRIAFASTRNNHSEIYSMSSNGSGQTRLTNTGNTASDPINDMPCWSPDGGLTPSSQPTGQIVFRSSRAGRTEIYVMNANGTTQTRVTTNNTSNYSPAWSAYPQVLFVSNASGTQQLYRMNSNGTAVTQLTTVGNNTQPAWAPDYYTFVFVSDRSGTQQIYTANADGSNQTRREISTAKDSQPTFSPDSTSTYGTITFVSDRTGIAELFNLDIGTNTVSQLTSDGDVTGAKGHPSYAPDASQITYSGGTGSNSIVFVANADGSNPVGLVTGVDPTWSPNGDRIAFSTDYNVGANFEIFTITIDGSTATRLTSNTVLDAGPAWSTDGRKLLFYRAAGSAFRIWICNPDGSGAKVLLTNTLFTTATNWLPTWAR